MKKALSILLVCAMLVGMALTLASCGDKKGKVKVDPDKAKYTVGICQLVQHPALDAATQGFKDALTKALTEAGREVEFLSQNAQGDTTTVTTIINTFVSNDVDLIMANATASLQTAYNATETIPILGTSITEYGVALGIEDFDGVVGGNVSGTSDLAPLETQAQMMIDTLGIEAAHKIGLLYCSAEPNSKYQVDVVKAYFEKKGITAKEFSFSDANDLSVITEKAAKECRAIYVPTDNTVASNTTIINNICSAAKVPVFAGEEGICSGCGYATLSISYYNIGVKTGEMAADVLLGRKSISEMPIEYDAEPVKKYNEAICNAIGIDVEILKKEGYVKIEAAE